MIGNGADVERLSNADGIAVRCNLKSGESVPTGHIANHAGWSGLIFLLDVFKSSKKLIPQAAFVIGAFRIKAIEFGAERELWSQHL